jgi:single-strand DNA-binding protein
MLYDLNEIRITGRLTRDPELKTTQNGKAIVKFGVAVHRGENDNVMFFNCHAWEKVGEFIAGNFKKGDPVFLCGHLHQRKWEDETTHAVNNYIDINIYKMYLLGKHEKSEAIENEMSEFEEKG